MSRARIQDITPREPHAPPKRSSDPVHNVFPNPAAHSALPEGLRGKPVLRTVMVPISDPTAYVAICDGDCLAPAIRDGDRIVFSPRTRVAKSMFVGVNLKNGGTPFVKRLVSEIPAPPRPGDEIAPLLALEMDNPSKRFFVHMETVDCIHAVAGVLRDEQYIPLIAKTFSGYSAKKKARQPSSDWDKKDRAIAALEFGPVGIALEKLPTNEEFGKHMVAVRLAAVFLKMTKAEMIEKLRTMDNGGEDSLIFETLGVMRRAAEQLQANCACIRSAEARILSAAHALGISEGW
jgi:hypothetical protein